MAWTPGSSTAPTCDWGPSWISNTTRAEVGFRSEVAPGPQEQLLPDLIGRDGLDAGQLHRSDVRLGPFVDLEYHARGGRVQIGMRARASGTASSGSDRAGWPGRRAAPPLRRATGALRGSRIPRARRSG